MYGILLFTGGMRAMSRASPLPGDFGLNVRWGRPDPGSNSPGLSPLDSSGSPAVVARVQPDGQALFPLRCHQVATLWPPITMATGSSHSAGKRGSPSWQAPETRARVFITGF